MAGLALRAMTWRFKALCLATLILAFVLQGYLLFLSLRKGTTVAFIDGLQFLANKTEPQGFINQLPAGSRIYLEGMPSPFYICTPYAYHNPFDASPLGAELRTGSASEALAWLRQKGFTHLLIDWWMLKLYWTQSSFGYDPEITPDRLMNLTRGLQPAFQDAANGVVIYKLP